MGKLNKAKGYDVFAKTINRILNNILIGKLKLLEMRKEKKFILNTKMPYFRFFKS